MSRRTVTAAGAPAATLAVADLEIELALPHAGLEVDFLGPTLRGLIGYGLREVACHHASDQHGRCSCPARCDYAYLFEGAHPAPPHVLLDRSSALPQPFRLLVPAPHSARDPHAVRFAIRLFGSRAIGLAPRVIDAIDARRPHGIGFRAAHYTLADAAIGPTRTLRLGTAATPARTLDVRFLTPTMLRQSQRAPDQTASPHAPATTGTDLVRAGRARAWLLAHAYGSGAAHLPDHHLSDATGRAPRVTLAGQPALASWRIRRHSGRQHRTVDLAGVMGQCTFDGNWSAERWWLGIAHEIGLGRHTSFGLGHVQLPDVEPAHAEPTCARTRLPRWIQLRGLPPAHARTRPMPTAD